MPSLAHSRDPAPPANAPAHRVRPALPVPGRPLPALPRPGQACGQRPGRGGAGAGDQADRRRGAGPPGALGGGVAQGKWERKKGGGGASRPPHTHRSRMLYMLRVSRWPWGDRVVPHARLPGKERERERRRGGTPAVAASCAFCCFLCRRAAGLRGHALPGPAVWVEHMDVLRHLGGRRRERAHKGGRALVLFCSRSRFFPSARAGAPP